MFFSQAKGLAEDLAAIASLPADLADALDKLVAARAGTLKVMDGLAR